MYYSKTILKIHYIYALHFKVCMVVWQKRGHLNTKPTVPFMVMKENRIQSTTEDTLRVVKESIHDSMYESSKTLVKQLDKIGDKLANVVEDFQKKQR